MNIKLDYKIVLAALCAAVISVPAQASDLGVDSATSHYAGSATTLQLAMNDDAASSTMDNTASVASPTTVKLPGLTGNKVHQYLGLGTLALVGLTALTAPDHEGNQAKPTSGTHQTLGRAAAAMAAATVTTGLVYHWKDFHLEDGLADPDNLHVMLAGAGALAMLYAVSRAPDSGHSGTGILGGLAMGVAIKLTW